MEKAFGKVVVFEKLNSFLKKIKNLKKKNCNLKKKKKKTRVSRVKNGRLDIVKADVKRQKKLELVVLKACIPT